jgi:hypothetical protein
MLEKILPYVQNSKYARITIHLLRTVLEAHPEPAIWKNKVLACLQEELENIDSMAKLDGLLELVEHNFE